MYRVREGEAGKQRGRERAVVLVGLVVALVLTLFVAQAMARAPAAAEVPPVGDWLAIVDQFFRDARLYVIVALIGLDVVLGVAVAIKVGAFQWAELGRFYRTMVAPNVIGYLALYVVFRLLPDALDDLIGVGPAEMTAQVLVTAAFAVIVINLGASIWAHLGDLGVAAAKRAARYVSNPVPPPQKRPESRVW